MSAPEGGGPTIVHGTRAGYVKGHCHCAACTDANRRYVSEYRARRRAQRAADGTVTDADHGTVTGYAVHACTCPACRAAHAAHRVAERARN